MITYNILDYIVRVCDKGNVIYQNLDSYILLNGLHTDNKISVQEKEDETNGNG